MKGLALALAVAACTGRAAPHSRAERIGSLEDVVGGPHAVGRIGDFLLENDQIRLVISDTGIDPVDPSRSTLGRVNTTFGGSLVDADLQRVGGGEARGNDQLAELLPGLVFTVIDPTDVCIPTVRTGTCPESGAPPEPLRDGSDGGAAEVLVTGTGGDLLQMVALLNTGLVSPSNLELSVVYRLPPGAKYVEIETTIVNRSPGAHPFPFLQPQELKDLGLDIPGLENLELSVPMGMLPLLGGEQELFTPGRAGFNVEYALEDTYALAGGFPAFPGMVADFVASRGRGVSYGLTVLPSAANYVAKFAERYPEQEITPTSVLLPFTYAGVAGVYMVDPPAQLAAGERFSYTSYFVVGRGDVASVADTIYALRGTPTGGFGGSVVDALTGAPVAAANVFVLDAKGQPIDQIQTDADGAFLATLPPGAYSYVVMADDRLTTAPASVAIAAGETTGVFVQIDPPATLVVAARDEAGRAAPVKVQLVGTFAGPSTPPADPRDFLYDLRFGERKRPTSFDGTSRFVEAAWWTPDGRLTAQVRPGTYDLVVSRGPEYETVTRRVVLKAGAFAGEQVALTRAFATPGWVAGDFHLHAQPSTDSGVPVERRVVSCAAEGLEIAAATDHNFITDYAPAIAAAGLETWLLGLPGMELTTFEMGHFNGYPLVVDPGSPRGGEFRWANQPPQVLFDTLRELGGSDPARTVVQVNHPRQQVLGYWAQFFVDEATAAPFTPTGILGVFAPFGDEFRAENYSDDFDAVELLTGKRIEDVHTFRAPDPLPAGPFPDPQPVPGEIVVGADGRAQFPGVVETWFAMLDRGQRPTGMGTSDSHGLLGDEPGYARTLLFVGPGNDALGGVSRDDVVGAIKARRAVVTNAPFVELTTADGAAMIGDEVRGASHTFRIRVRAPSWAPVDTLVVYSNSAVVQTIAIPAPGTTFETTIELAPPRDAWIVVEVTGRANMFPVVTPTELPPLDVGVIISALAVGLDLSSLPIASNLKPARVHTTTPYAITNPIWIDRDGDGFTPPVAKRRSASSQAVQPDVRAQFEGLPEVTP